MRTAVLVTLAVNEETRLVMKLMTILQALVHRDVRNVAPALLVLALCMALLTPRSCAG